MENYASVHPTLTFLSPNFYIYYTVFYGQHESLGTRQVLFMNPSRPQYIPMYLV